jgi:Mg-chelatase subunit ChlD
VLSDGPGLDVSGPSDSTVGEHGTRTTVRLLAAFAALAVGTLVAAPAHATPATLPEVLDRLGVNSVPADYVVMVDTSASMQANRRYDTVKANLRAFFAALAPDDQVALGTFADAANVVYQGPAGRSPDALIAKLPPTASGGNTDIGAAIESIVHLLQRPQAPAIATVVLLTDGQHDPPTGSPYPYTQGYAWDRLTDAAKALRKQSFNAFAVPLAGATGAPLLAKVFPGARVVDPTSIDQLGAQLELPKAAARIAKARSIVGDDAGRGVEVRWPADVGKIGAGRTELTVHLRSIAAHVPLVVRDLHARSSDGTVRVSSADNLVELEPGRSKPVRIAVEWDPGPRRAAPLSTVSRQVDLELLGTVDSPWSDVLTRELAVPFDPQLTGGPVTAGFGAQRGSYPLWILGAVVAGAVLAGLLRLRARRLRPALSGTLLARADGHDHRLPLQRRSAVLSAGTIGLPGYGEVHANRPSVGSPEVVLTVTYSKDGSASSRAAGTCRPGGKTVLDGVEFSWEVATGSGPRRIR